MFEAVQLEQGFRSLELDSEEWLGLQFRALYKYSQEVKEVGDNLEEWIGRSGDAMKRILEHIVSQEGFLDLDLNQQVDGVVEAFHEYTQKRDGITWLQFP